MDPNSGRFCKDPFSFFLQLEKKKIVVSSDEIQLDNEDLSLNTVCFQWHSMDNKKQLWLEFSLLTWVYVS